MVILLQDIFFDESISPHQNRWTYFSLGYNRDVDYWNSLEVGASKGVYEGEPYVEYFLEKPQRLTDRLITTFEGNYRITDANSGVEEDTWLVRSVTTYNFTWGSRLKFTAEKTSEDRHNITALFSWPIKKAIDFYVLFNNYKTDEEKVREVFIKGVYRFD